MKFMEPKICALVLGRAQKTVSRLRPIFVHGCFKYQEIFLCHPMLPYVFNCTCIVLGVYVFNLFVLTGFNLLCSDSKTYSHYNSFFFFFSEEKRLLKILCRFCLLVYRKIHLKIKKFF